MGEAEEWGEALVAGLTSVWESAAVLQSVLC
jgi:hypothetical protein